MERWVGCQVRRKGKRGWGEGGKVGGRWMGCEVGRRGNAEFSRGGGAVCAGARCGFTQHTGVKCAGRGAASTSAVP